MRSILLINKLTGGQLPPIKEYMMKVATYVAIMAWTSAFAALWISALGMGGWQTLGVFLWSVLIGFLAGWINWKPMEKKT